MECIKTMAKDKCCGMSMVFNTNSYLSNVFFIDEVKGARFYTLLTFVFLFTLINDVIMHKIFFYKKHNPLMLSLCEICVFAVAWMIMMISMTSNLYIMAAIMLGKFISKLLIHTRDKKSTAIKTCAFH